VEYKRCSTATATDAEENAMRRSTLFMGLILLLDVFPARAAEPRPAPPWQGSQAGISQEVLPPWTPITVAGNEVGVWGRTYRFGPLPLPAAVVARDADLLAGAVTLSGAAGGKPLVWQGASCRVLEAKPHLARLAATAESDSLRCQGEVHVEYDGMIRCELSLHPKGRQATIERLDLEIPLVAEHALLLHTWPGRWGSAANSTALPKDGYRGPWKPFIWLGDHQRGFAWFCESDRNFVSPKPDRVVEIERAGQRVVLRVRLLAAPQTIDRPLEYTFGFQATPVKPARPDAWDYRIVHMGGYGLDAALLDRLARSGVRTMCFHEHWTDIQNYPKTTHGRELDKLVSACHARNIQLLLYFGYEMSNIAPEWDRYHEECLVQPRAGGYKRKPEQTAYVVCYRSHWQDFLAEGIERVMAEHGVDGVYLDGTSEPWGCANALHGCGYRRPDGSLGPTYSFFATRQMMKRIYTIVKHRNPAGQVNVHQSTCMTIPTLAFATSYWDGEQLQGLKRPSAPLEVLPLDAFATEFMGHNWGVPAELLWYGNGPFRRVEAMSLGLLHDVPVRPGGIEDVEVAGRLWKTFDAFGRHEASWLPYWANDRFVRCQPAGVKVSLYNRPGKGLLAVIVNSSPQPCQAVAAFDLAALRQPAGLAACDVLADKAIALADGRVQLPLGPLEHVVVWLKSNLQEYFQPPAEYAGKLGKYRSPLVFADGTRVRSAADWARRRQEILAAWHRRLGPWPPLVERPAVKRLQSLQRDGYTQHHVHVQIAPDGAVADGYLLVPAGRGPFPAALVPFYEPLTSIGQGAKGRGTHDYGLQLVRRGFVTLSIGTPGPIDNIRRDWRRILVNAGARQRTQPLTLLAYAAANCHTALAQMPEVDPGRIGIIGVSYGGKWAMFASCLYDKFACAVWSDGGIVFDEQRPNVNYWEPWYLGYDPKTNHPEGVPSAANPRTGLYKEMVEAGEDLVELHALMAPRPVLVSGGTEDPPERWLALNHLLALNDVLGCQRRVALTSRPTHTPTPEALELELSFLEYWLKSSLVRPYLGPAMVQASPGDVVGCEHFAFLRASITGGLGGPAREALRSWGSEKAGGIDRQGTYYHIDGNNAMIQRVRDGIVRAGPARTLRSSGNMDNLRFCVCCPQRSDRYGAS
jgi:dienelactone hydrolase